MCAVILRVVCVEVAYTSSRHHMTSLSLSLSRARARAPEIRYNYSISIRARAPRTQLSGTYRT